MKIIPVKFWLNYFLCGMLCFIFGIGSYAKAVESDDNIAGEVSVEIYSPEKLLSAYAVLIPNIASSVDLKSKAIAEEVRRTVVLKEMSSGVWKAIAKLNKEDFVEGNMIAVVAVDKSGRTLTSSVKKISTTDKSPVLFAQLSCTSESVINRLNKMLLIEQEGLQEIVKIRKQKKALLMSVVNKLLTQEVLSAVSKEESRLGIENQVPVSENLPKELLAERLAAIQALSSKQQ